MSEKEATPAKALTAEDRMVNREADRAADAYQQRYGW